MHWLHNLPVQRKLGFAMLLTSVVALVSACAVFITVEYVDYKRSLARTVATLARITADNTTAALAFSDPKAALQTLESLHAEPQIVAALLYDNNGNVFARFAPAPQQLLKSVSTAPGVRLEQGYMIGIEPVVENSRQLGTLYLQASMGGLYSRLRHYALVAVGVLAVSLALAWQIASMLRRTLAEPILELANTADAVSAYQDFTLRARRFGNDELGRLTVAFNSMLERAHTTMRALRESEWSHRELVRALPVAAYMCDASGKITLYNEAAVNLWGRAPEIGFESWSGSEKIFASDGAWLPSVACTGAIALDRNYRVPPYEIVIERHDGSRRNVMAYPEVIRDTNGKVTGFVNMLLDVTEQKKADADARRLAAIVQSSDDAIIGKNLEGVVTSWNHGAELLFGYTAEEMQGQPIMKIIPPERESEEHAILERLRRGEAIKYEETVRRRKDGSLVDVSLTISPIRGQDGRIIGASKIAHAITERKRAEREALFVYQLSHRLSTLDHPDEILRIAAQELGEHLQVDRCFFCVMDESATHALVKEDWSGPGFESISGIHRLIDFGTSDLWKALASGPVVVEDKHTDPLVRNIGVGYESLRITAHLSVPFVRNGRWIALLIAITSHPRKWTNEEIALTENVLARVWPMVERAHSQRDLLESERRQRELMQRLPIPCYTVDDENRLTFFNDAAVQLWQQKPNLGSVSWFTLQSPDGSLLPFAETPSATALLQKRSVRGVEGFVVRPDGSRRWVVFHSDPLFESYGTCTGVLNVITDVTEERLAQVKVQKTAEHLSLAIASANLGDWSWDPTSDRISLSDRTAEIFGIPLQADIRRSQMQAILHEEDRRRSQEAMLHALRNRTDYDIEYRIRRTDGTTRWVAVKGRPICRDDGQVQVMVGVAQDITERKAQAEKLQQLAEELEAQARLFDAILSNLTDLAYAFDLDGRFIFANRPLLELLGRSAAEVVGKTVYELNYPPELADRVHAQVMEAVATKRAVRGETQFTAANGRVDDHEYIYNPVLSDQGEVTAVVGSTRLITERKHTENELKRARDEAVAASRAKDDFLAALSHELRTPLNPVLLIASDSAVNPALPPGVRKDFELIRKNVDLEARLIDDLLDITRITRGKLLLDQRKCDLHGILRDALSNVRSELQEKKIELTLDMKADEWAVWGDSVRLQQVLWNILKNAVKFTPAGGRIQVETHSTHDTFSVTVTDTGIGMSESEIGRIFRAFSQGEHASPGANMHRFGGLGLGLAISKMLAELHGGAIQASSEGRNKGSTFVVSLPLDLHTPDVDRAVSPKDRRSKSLSPFPAAEDVASSLDQRCERRILLVEDHTPTRQTLQHLLKSRRYDVTAAKSATEALEAARENDFALLISDVGLPDKTGFELMKELRSLRPNLPGIALSGYGMEEDLERSQAAGFSVHLVKPVTITMLEEAITNLLLASRSQPRE